MRHKHLLGQTLPCPKCKHPVHVVPSADPLFPSPIPEGMSSDGGVPPAVNSEAITKADDPANWDIESVTSQTFQHPTPQADEAESRAQPGTRITKTEPAPLPNRRPDAWESRDVVARRNILLVVLIAASGLLLAGTVFFVFVRSFGKSTRLTKNPPSIEQPETPLETAANVEPVPDEKTETPSDSPLPGQDPVVEPTPLVPVPVPPMPDAGSLPLNLVPEADLASVTENPPATPDPTLANVEDKLPTVFEDFQRMFDAPSRGRWDDVGKSDRTIENEIALENTEVLFREEYYPNPIPLPDWTERSQRVLASVKTKPMPLLRCFQWFSKVANTGISADWLELKLVGVDLTEPIAIEGQNRSIGELLEEICQQRGLQVQIDSSGFPRVRPVQDRVDALKGPDGVLNTEKWIREIPAKDRDVWVPLMIRMLDLSQCQYAQGRLEWSAEASTYDRARFIAAMQSLILASKNSDAAPAAIDDLFGFGQPASWLALREKIEVRMPMDMIVYEERPVIDLLSMACDQADVQLVIDWPAAWSHGLHPSRMGVSVVRGRTLEEIANRYLEDYSLELLPLDASTLLLTSDRVRRSIEQVVPIRLDRGMNIDDVKLAIRALVPRGLDQRSRFRWEGMPGNDQLALLRICLPALIHLRDPELQRAFGVQSPNTKIERQ